MVKIILLVLSAILPMAIHEGGHYLVALTFSKRLHFKFSWGRFHVPRWTWLWPQGVNENQLRTICQAGFVFEIAAMPFMPWPYQVVAVVHFTAYPWYAGDMSDFKGMIQKKG